MMTLSGSVPFISMYFLSALATAGFMVLSSSELGLSWMLALEMNFVKV